MKVFGRLLLGSNFLLLYYSGCSFDTKNRSCSRYQCFDFQWRPLRSISSTLMARSLSSTNLEPQPLQVSLGLKDIDVLEWKGDLIAIGVTEMDMGKDTDTKFENTILNKLDLKLGGLLAKASSEEGFTGKPRQSPILRLTGFGSKRIGLIGLGHQSPSIATYRGFGETVAAVAKTAQASNVAVVLAAPPQNKLTTVSAIASGTILGTREDLRFKSESKKPSLKSLDIIGFVLPLSWSNPGALVEEASKIASEFDDVFTAKILNADECKELGMGSYLAVAAASANPSHFIHLYYKPPGGPAKAKLALVGNSLTFDSGGNSIKTGLGCSCALMKFDMSGSTAVLGAAKAIGQIKPAGVEVHFIVAACENIISGTGMRPGDIVTASNGKKIEVNNTGAEGRLTLADALVYACNQGVEKIIDLATLAGACHVPLRPSLAGVFTPDEALADEVIVAAIANREKLWRVPMEDSYWESVKSGVVDMVNTGSCQGGAMTAALFLNQFVDEKVQWMHIDMASPVWNEKHLGTGFGVLTLVDWVLTNSS